MGFKMRHAFMRKALPVVGVGIWDKQNVLAVRNPVEILECFPTVVEIASISGVSVTNQQKVVLLS
jgi:hypothetical protein